MKKEMDYLILAIMLILIFFGFAMIASVSVYESYNKFEQNDFYFWKQLVHMAIGFVGFFVCLMIPYRWWDKLSLFIMATSLFLLMLVFTSLGADFGSSHSWLDIPYLPSIQPVEIAKFGLIVYLSSWMAKNRPEIKKFKYGFLPFMIILSIIAIPLALQPDFGSLILIILTSVAIFLIAGGSILQVFAGGFFASLLGFLIAYNVDYIYNRFVTFFNPELDTLGISYQIKNALTAIGSGGLFGLGFGQSIQKNGYLPEVQGDTIFAAIGEEMGFLRTALIVLLFLILALRCYTIARNTKEVFAKLITVGFATSLTIQMLINVAVNMALLPNTGITLPFISYGGNSLVISMMMIGIILNISKGAPLLEDRAKTRRVFLLRRQHYF